MVLLHVLRSDLRSVTSHDPEINAVYLLWRNGIIDWILLQVPDPQVQEVFLQDTGHHAGLLQAQQLQAGLLRARDVQHQQQHDVQQQQEILVKKPIPASDVTQSQWTSNQS